LGSLGCASVPVTSNVRPYLNVMNAPRRYQLSWAVDGVGFADVQPRGLLSDPSWSDVLRILNFARGGRGTVQLSLLDPPEVGPQELQLILQGHRGILMLGVLTENDHFVRTLWNPDTPAGSAELGAYNWDQRTVCSDTRIFEEVFLEFFQSGDVSAELLR